jgi:hypothetical protein
VKALLESGKLAKPGNSYMMVNPLGSQLQFLRTRCKEGCVRWVAVGVRSA